MANMGSIQNSRGVLLLIFFVTGTKNVLIGIKFLLLGTKKNLLPNKSFFVTCQK